MPICLCLFVVAVSLFSLKFYQVLLLICQNVYIVVFVLNVNSILVDAGAGDAFAGAMLVEYIWTADWKRSLQAGVLAGSAAVMSVGGSSCSQQSLVAAELLLRPTAS